MTTQRPFDAVLFDMDGVIIDNMALHRQIWAEYAREHGHAPSEVTLRSADGQRAVDVVRLLFGAELPEAQAQTLAEIREERYRDYLRTHALPAVPGVAAYLAALERAGIPRVLATSATPENVALVLDRLGLGAMFDATVSAADVSRGKPAPDIYLLAAQRAQVAPERCLAVEDSLPGLQAALAAGTLCLGLMTSESDPALRRAGARWTAADFLALPADLQVSGG